MDALLRSTKAVGRRQQQALLFCKRLIGSDPSWERRGSFIRSRLHREWKQVNVLSRRIETRVGDFRTCANELLLYRGKLQAATEEAEKARIIAFIKQREKEIATDAVEIHTDLSKLTAVFVEGAEREYAALRGFFLLFVYHTARTSSAYENLDAAAFNRLLLQTADGITFEAPKRGTVTLRPHLCKVLANAANNLALNTSGEDNSPLAIALAIAQAFPQKHCGNRNCRREDCVAVKADHEELFESFFKSKPKSLVFQKCREELTLDFEDILVIPEDKPKSPLAEVPPQVVTQAS